MKPQTSKRHVGNQEALTQEEEQAYQAMFEEQLPLILACKQGNPEALEKLEQLSRQLRKAKAQKFLPSRPDLHEDAMHAGWTGVLHSLRKWDPKWKRLFLAFAHWDISEAIREYKYEMEMTVSRPTHIHRKLSKLAKYNATEPEELAKLSGMTLNAVRKVIALKQGDVSLQEMQLESEEDIGNRIIPTQLSTLDVPLHRLEKADLVEVLRTAMQQLDDREGHVVFLYYHTDSTFSQIAETMNLTRQRVEQICSSGVAKMQKHFLKHDPDLQIFSRKKTRTKKDENQANLPGFKETLSTF